MWEPLPECSMPQMSSIMALGARFSGCRPFSAHGLRITKKHEVSYSAKGGLPAECGVQMRSSTSEY